MNTNALNDPDRQDLLISRAVDGVAAAEDWAELERAGAADPSVWQRLGSAVRDQSALSAAVEERIGAADSVELPGALVRAQYEFRVRLRSWSGWAAAAVIGLSWLGAANWITLDALPSAGVQSASLGAALTPDEVLDQYRTTGLEEGRYLGELPMVMVETRPTPDGAGMEVIYLRQLLERAVVGELYELGMDEQGQPAALPVSTPWATSTSPL